jgi:hypothetical protein
MQHCHPDTIFNASTSLHSLFNDVQGDSESIFKYCFRFDGLTLELACCKVVIPSILLVMLFLHALHGCYTVIVKQFQSRFKPIKSTTIDSIVSDVTYHDGFEVINHSKKGKPGSSPRLHVPVAVSANTNSDCQSKVWQTPFEWLAQKWYKGHQGSLDACHGWYRNSPHLPLQ